MLFDTLPNAIRNIRGYLVQNFEKGSGQVPIMWTIIARM